MIISIFLKSSWLESTSRENTLSKNFAVQQRLHIWRTGIADVFLHLVLKFNNRVSPRKLIMAFQMPLILNDYDLYKTRNDAKSRSVDRQSSSRSLKTSESMSSQCSNGVVGNPLSHRNLQHVSSRNQFSRINSRTSQSSLAASQKPTQTNNCKSTKEGKDESKNCMNKMHNVVDKLRKAFKSNSTTSWNICKSEKWIWKHRKIHSKKAFDQCQPLTSNVECNAPEDDKALNPGNHVH